MRKQRGLTLAELMVAMVVGLFVLGGTYSVFSMSSVSVNATGQHNQLQESARLAMRMLHEDIAQAGFFADLTGSDLVSTTMGHPVLASGDDCSGSGLNNGSYPAGMGHFRTLWAEHVVASPSMSCVSNPIVNSDILQIKRLDGVDLKDTSLEANEIYMAVNVNQGEFFKGGDGQPSWVDSLNDLSRVYRYRHRIYYVRNNAGGNPTLYMHDLSSSGMASPSALVEGVEAIEYEFGIDMDGDAIVDTYLASSDVTTAMWDNSGLAQVVAVQVHLLLASVSGDASYQTNSVTFELPSGARTIANDGLRRKKIATTVMLRNPIFINQRNGI